MLLLQRKLEQRIFIGDHIQITIVKIGKGSVKIGIEAPDNIAVLREELAVKLMNDQSGEG